MPYPKEIRIDGDLITEVEQVEVNVECGENEKGFWARRTGAAKIKLMRRARNTPNQKFFKHATNGDGRLKVISGKIELQDAALNPTFVIDMKEMWIESWEFNQAGEDADLQETITLRVGNMSLGAAGKSTVDFKVPQFHKK